MICRPLRAGLAATMCSVLWGCADGSDSPAVTGSDGDEDGLSAEQEASLGTDPRVADSDGDGYRDGVEVTSGHDPLDPADRIYAGGWPFVSEKPNVPPFRRAVVRWRFIRAALPDQFGDAVDLYDFMGDRPVVVQVAGMWCEPCRQLSAWLRGAPSDLDGVAPDAARDAILTGRVWWLTVIAEDNDGALAVATDASDCYAAWPIPEVPVLADVDGVVRAFANGPAGPLPDVWMLDGDMVATLHGQAGDLSVLDAVAALQP